MVIRIAAVVCVAAMLSSCGSISSPSDNHVDTPSGTISSGGVGPVHTFTVSKAGEFFVTITALSPDQNIFLGIVWGQPASNTCQQLQSNFQAHLNTQALGGQIQKGTYCVQLGDSNGLVSPTTPTTYTLRISYP